MIHNKEVSEDRKKMIIPKQLARPEFRFYLIARNSKIPMEKSWNLINNYQYNSQRLQDHISNNGNYGIVTGTKHDNKSLIILDFDDIEFWQQNRYFMPDTLTIQTASKKLYHYYYFLRGEPIKKIGIDNNNKRTLDIQSDGSGIVAPGSKILKDSYKVAHDKPIKVIGFDYLKKIFNITLKRKSELKLH